MTTDIDVQKLFMRFIIKTLQIFDEEVVERAQEKPVAELGLSTQVKDFVRQGQIGSIIEVLKQVIQNHAMFNAKTVKGTLKVLAQLIDWNELALFAEVVQPCKEFVKVKGYRAGGMTCLGAIVGKGMDPVQKLTVIKQVEFMEVLNTVQI